MNYDIFISYTRRDNTNNQVASLVDQVAARFATFAGRPLRPFFDTREIEGGEYWQDKILTGLKESRLMLACLSPGYLESQWCEWEFIEYQKYELGRAYLGKGMAPIYFVTVPGFDQPDFEATCAQWVAELRRRQHYDLRPWHGEGEAALEQLDVAERLDAISQQVWEQIRLGEQVEQRKGNLDRANEYFVGRSAEMQRLNRLVSLGRVGVLTAVNGLGGMGKTALALQYAHAYGHLFAGGCWQIRCEGKIDLKEAFASLRGQRDMDYNLNEEEQKSLELQFERVLRELKHKAEAARLEMVASPGQKREVGRGRVLVILDNVDQPELLADEQTRFLPQADWLCLLGTTRLGAEDLENIQEQDFLSMDELPEEDCLALIESYQPNRSFSNVVEHKAALEIIRLLDGLPLAVEVAAVYMGTYRIPCEAFLARLRKDGHEYFHLAEKDKRGKIRHGEKCLALTLQPTLERLSAEEQLALDYASLHPADQIPLSWLRHLVATHFSGCGQDARPGEPDPWLNVVQRLFSFRLLQQTGVMDHEKLTLVARMHRLVGEMLRQRQDKTQIKERQEALAKLAIVRAKLLNDNSEWRVNRWELKSLATLSEWWTAIAMKERDLGNLWEAKRLMLMAVAIDEQVFGINHPHLASSYSNLALVEWDFGNLSEAKQLFLMTVAIDEQAFGTNHPNLVSRYSDLALVEWNLGNLGNSKCLLLKAIAIDEMVYGPPGHSLATSYSNLALLEVDLGNIGEAKRLLLNSAVIFEKVLEPGHSTLASIYVRICDVLILNMELEAAVSMLQKCAGLPMPPSEDEEHVSLYQLKCYQLQGSLAMEQQQFDKAITWFRQGLEQAEKAEAAGQTEAGSWADSFHYRLAFALYEARLPESNTVIEEAISRCRKWAAETNQDNAYSFLARSLILKARSLFGAQQMNEAVPLAEETQALLQPLAQKAWLPRTYLAESQQLLAEIYEALGNTVAASQFREEAAVSLQRPKEWEL